MRHVGERQPAKVSGRTEGCRELVARAARHLTTACVNFLRISLLQSLGLVCLFQIRIRSLIFIKHSNYLPLLHGP